MKLTFLELLTAGMVVLQQENSLQTFKLPKPAICTGGILQVELLGRVQKQEMDDLYYIWLVLLETWSVLCTENFKHMLLGLE